MILLIDNFDSFSYNLYQMIGAINPDIRVVRNNELSVEDVRALAPSHIVLGPGPGRPEDAGITMDVARTVSTEIPTLGVCLGEQAICAAYGATVMYADSLMHGKQSDVTFDTNSVLFRDCPQVGSVARYHSLVADASTLPDELRVTGATATGEVMAVEHTRYPIYGVQFHPESILTPNGEKMIRNFLAL